MTTKRLLIVGAAALLAGAIAGGIAYATIPGPGNVYFACMRTDTGTLRLIDKSLPASNAMSHCKPTRETEISWNQTGPQGPAGGDGVSVTSDAEPAGGNCTNGGSKFTAVNGVTYACNGADGSGTAAPTVCTGVLGAAVHDVTGCSLLLVPSASASPVITDLTGGVAGQIVTVMVECVALCAAFNPSATLNRNSTLLLAGNAVLNVGDTLQLINAGRYGSTPSLWVELGRSDN